MDELLQKTHERVMKLINDAFDEKEKLTMELLKSSETAEGYAYNKLKMYEENINKLCESLDEIRNELEERTPRNDSDYRALLYVCKTQGRLNDFQKELNEPDNIERIKEFATYEFNNQNQEIIQSIDNDIKTGRNGNSIQQHSLKIRCNETDIKNVMEEYIRDCTFEVITLLNGDGANSSCNTPPSAKTWKSYSLY